VSDPFTEAERILNKFEHDTAESVAKSRMLDAERCRLKHMIAGALDQRGRRIAELEAEIKQLRALLAEVDEWHLARPYDPSMDAKIDDLERRVAEAAKGGSQ